MVHRDDECRRKAAEAQRCARRARTDDERANWLLLAEGWLDLLRKCPQSDERVVQVFRIKSIERANEGGFSKPDRLPQLPP